MSESRAPVKDIVFFLGAGASVKANVPDTFRMVSEFLAELDNDLKKKEVVLEIIRILEINLHGINTRVDVELLLETIDNLEYRDSNIVLKFFEVNKFLLADDVNLYSIKNELKSFIKSKGIAHDSSIQYLEPFNEFISDYGILNIFSVNYDICIEQFCNNNLQNYVDGFNIYWNPELFKREDIDIKLYKLHGSVTWYSSDRGDYLKLPIMTKESETKLITGETATTLILYPIQKWEYSGPFLDLLSELKRNLEHTKILVVVGYSFRDEHIKRIFWDASRINREFIMFLISPSSNKIYHEKLKDYKVEELEHGFDSNFNNWDFDAYSPSSLVNKVIRLPYLFEKVFPRLKNFYIKELVRGINLEKESLLKETEGEDPYWHNCLEHYIKCEYMDKVIEINKKIDWSNYVNNYFRATEISYYALLSYMLLKYKNESNLWLERFLSCMRKISIDTLVPAFQDNDILSINFRVENYSFSPDNIRIMFEKMMDVSNFRLSALRKEKAVVILPLIEAIKEMLEYFSNWKLSWMSPDEYASLRKDKYPEVDKRIKVALATGTRDIQREQMQKIIYEVESMELLNHTKKLQSFMAL